jgi:hypothetical protein
MKNFRFDSRMLTMSGEFYPTGFLFVMLPTLDHASTLESSLNSANIGGDDVFLLTSSVILEQIAPTASHHGDTLPSIGTESAMVQKYRRLALDGHCAVMVRGGNAEHTEEVMGHVRKLPFSIAEKYRFLVIEDMD